MASKLTCIESFSGCGGLALGASNAGFDIRAAFDFDSYAIESYRSYFKDDVAFVADARQLSVVELLLRARLAPGECDLFSGGPPCQGFSKQKRGAENGDERNSLILEFVRFVEGIKPKFFLLENVDQFGKKRGAEFTSELSERLSRSGDSGYRIFHHFFNSADFGLAQTRVRYMLIGQRRDVPQVYRLPVATHKESWKTVGEVIGDLPEPPEDYSDHPDFPNHQAARVTQINIERFSHVPQGGGWRDIPEDLRLACHAEPPKSGGWPDVYGRLRWDGQCPTLTGGFDSFTRGRYGHPLRDRPLTPREAARLQGFPDEFVFYGTRHHIRHQIGNAVPPPLAEAVAKSIAACLVSQPATEDQPLPNVLYQESLSF